MSKSADNFAVFYLFWSVAVACHLNHLAEVLMTVWANTDVLPAWETCRIGSEDTLRIVGVGQWRNDAVGGEDDRTVEV